MSFRIVDVADVPLGPGPHPAASPFDKKVSAELGLRRFELYQVELPAGETTVLHDHLEDGVEDAYVVTSGGGWLLVDGEEVELRVGHAVAVTQESVRAVRAGDEGCVLIAVCA